MTSDSLFFSLDKPPQSKSQHPCGANRIMNIPRQYQSIIDQAVASGAFATPEEALQHALELLAKEQRIPNGATSPENRRLNLSARFRQWAESHPPSNHFVDDSRESIY